MGNLTGSLHQRENVKGQNQEARNRKSVLKEWATPETYLWQTSQRQKGINEAYAPLLERIRAIQQGPANSSGAASLAKYGLGSHPIAGAFQGANQSRGQAASGEAMRKFYLDALLRGQREGGAGIRQVMAALAGQPYASYANNSTSSGFGLLSDLLLNYGSYAGAGGNG